MRMSCILVVLVLGGCSTVPYPVEWAAIDTKATADQCAPITGTYSQQGIAQTKKGSIWSRVEGPERSKFSALLGISFQPVDAVTHLSLNISTQDPDLTLWIGKDQLLTRKLKSSELSCEAGIWRLGLDWSAWRVGGVVMPVGASFYSLKLQQAVDGAVVVSKDHTIWGTAFFYVYYKMQDWHRFAPATDAALPLPSNVPSGVLLPGAAFARLLPPATLRQSDDNQRSQHRCLNDALAHSSSAGGSFAREKTAHLAGRYTQAFLAQQGRGDGPYAMTEKVEGFRGPVPSTRHATLHKPHWLDPVVADRYVSCLLNAGYVWEDVPNPADGRK